LNLQAPEVFLNQKGKCWISDDLGGTQGSKSQEQVEESQGKLSSSGVSQVNEDAMAVARALGKQYLWVDRYCIDQQDHDGKALQIRNMDRIYEGADATIVACAGSNADFGLPGVGLINRKCQLSAVVGDQILVSSPPPLAAAMKESAWMKRGWTYQEATLSRRCLFFTELQVYFVYREMNASNPLSDVRLVLLRVQPTPLRCCAQVSLDDSQDPEP
jgi:Heterokaryon incompatibility protein (HET)